MTKHPKKLLVVIAEAALERPIAEEARRLGAHGYTVYDVRGAGGSGAREGAWEADRTVEMKIVCDADVADKIAQTLLETYGENYALSLFFSDVAVLRANKY
jgi:nitrogen regulatory protein P-II 2